MTTALTLAEVESCLRKCARAVGLEWGIAEEAGKSARWLAAFGLPGPELMLAHLESLDSSVYLNWVPDCSLDIWTARGDHLCPIVTGAAMADRAASLLDGQTIRLGPTAYPLLLVATLGQAARFHDCVITSCWPGARVSCFAFDIALDGNPTALHATQVDAVECFVESGVSAEQTASTLAYSIDDDIYQSIDRLAFQTYVPASEESRAGAGAGLTDND